ncbi:hypothetical protein BC628DRAFT_1371452 [Trametes gibbosa]|nr:hypothetical protein BC628DRAFT_1371452 [Trametes gibbosa]
MSWTNAPGSTATIRPDVMEPASPEEGSNLKSSLSFDMKTLMGDGVGNMSISPDHRDVVLASRKGLSIIDLDTPLHLPRNLAQGGTWDVADVQWNPHISHHEYIVSTSSEKLLIWNLLLGARSSIEHVLRSHYRAITDINWHTIEPDIVISTGIDSWLWAWDLRAVQKPIMGLCAFGPGGTQVKWNRVDGNILASSHSDEVLIWDRRKGSLPIQRIRGHRAKIYGIDWAHNRRNELVTCSLDKTIKVWDTQSAEANTVINTTYPVWRARDLPFGQGVLSLPQRGETTLEMYAYEDPMAPIEKFAGQSDVVKEFVWRRGGTDNAEFQLITLTRDKTLQFWPVDTDAILKAGMTPTRTTAMPSRRRDSKASFSDPQSGNDLPPTLSAPLAYRGILEEVRAPPSHRLIQFENRQSLGRRRFSIAAREDAVERSGRSRPRPIPAMAASVKDNDNLGTMSRGPIAGGRSNQLSQDQWIRQANMGQRRDGSSGGRGGGDSGNVSRTGSRSKLDPSAHRSASFAFSRTRGRTSSRDNSEEHSAEITPSLNEEITSVVSKLDSPKLKLEKADFKRRTCTLGLQGPWGESTSVFLRVTFTFPADYPKSGIPSVELERSPLISLKQNAFILRRLRDTLKHQRPCLEKCLKFLLWGDRQEDIARHAAIDSESSEDEASNTRKGDNAISSLRHDKNLAEPRTSQGVFCANGQLVCFDNAPPRIVRNPLREMSMSPSVSSRAVDAPPRIFHSPALLLDAGPRLAAAARKHCNEPPLVESKRWNDEHPEEIVLRTMENLFTFWRLSYPSSQPRRASDQSRPTEDIPSQYALLPTRRSSVYTIYIRSTGNLLGLPDVQAAAAYVLTGQLSDMLETNIIAARSLGRSDHERLFKMLLILSPQGQDDRGSLKSFGSDSMVATLGTKLYDDLAAEKNIQMLVFVSILLLRVFPLEVDDIPSGRTRTSSLSPSPGGPAASRKISLEYFDSGRQRHESSLSPAGSNSPTPMHTPGGHAPPMASPSSSKGSWTTTLLNGSGMRQLVSGMRAASAITSESGKQGLAGSGGIRRAAVKREPARQSSNSPGAKSSWETHSSALSSNMMYAGGTRRPNFSLVPETRRIEFHEVVEIKPSVPFLSHEIRSQLICHVLAYADMLLIWELLERRSELLKLVEADIQLLSFDTVVADTALYSSTLSCGTSASHVDCTEHQE